MQQRNMHPEKTPSKFLGDPSKRFQSTGFTTSMQQRNKYPTIHYSILRLDTDIQILPTTHRALMSMYFKKVLLFPQEQFEGHNQNAPAPQKMSHRIKEKCDIFRRSRWHYRCGTQIAPAEYVTTSISRHGVYVVVGDVELN